MLQEFTPQTHLAIISLHGGRSSAGRASRSQCEGRGFDPLRLHQDSPALPRMSPAAAVAAPLVAGHFQTPRIALPSGGRAARSVIGSLQSKIIANNHVR